MGQWGRSGTARAAVTAVATAALLLPASAGAAEAPLPTVDWVPTAVLLSPGADADTASVIGKYRCAKGSPNIDIRVTVTQAVGSDGVDGGRAAAVYDQGARNSEEPVGLRSVCDGRPHLRTMPVASRFGSLESGTAYVHWCLSDTRPYALNDPGVAFNCNVQSVPAR